jgi:hypothetical protein
MTKVVGFEYLDNSLSLTPLLFMVRQSSVVIQVDADQIFLSDHNDASNVDAGSGVAAAYDLGQDWIQEWGYPFAITSAIQWKMARRGILRHALRPHSRRRAEARRPWSEVTKEMSQFINKEFVCVTGQQ